MGSLISTYGHCFLCRCSGHCHKKKWIRSLRVYPAMWHPSRLYIEPTDCRICWGTWWATSEQDPINEIWWSRSRLGLFDMSLDLGLEQRWLDAWQVNRFEFLSLVSESPGKICKSLWLRKEGSSLCMAPCTTQILIRWLILPANI